MNSFVQPMCVASSLGSCQHAIGCAMKVASRLPNADQSGPNCETAPPWRNMMASVMGDRAALAIHGALRHRRQPRLALVDERVYGGGDQTAENVFAVIVLPPARSEV